MNECFCVQAKLPRRRWITLRIVFVLVLAMLAAVVAAYADDYPCPPGAKSCKVLTLTPDEEQTLIGPEMIFDHAVWANRVKFEGMVQAWREKLRQAPAGGAKSEPSPNGEAPASGGAGLPGNLGAKNGR